MAMTDRQLRWYRESDLKRLRARIGPYVPLTVHCREREGGGTMFVVTVEDSTRAFEGRFQVAAAWIDGFVAAWSDARLFDTT
jgi:hypothetical protein